MTHNTYSNEPPRENLSIQDAIRISQEVYDENGEAEKKLCERCRWEKMSRPAVIIEWGDPREWK